MKKLLMMAATSVVLALASMAATAAPVISLTGTSVLNADGSVTPTLAWCTGDAATPQGVCSGTPASSCTASGAWTGTKGASGTQAQAAVTTTSTYTISCAWPGDDKITLTWKAPTTNSDGSTLTDLGGFKIFYGTSSSMSNNTVVDVKDPAATSKVLGPGLAPNTYYIVMDAYNTGGAESSKVPTPPLTKVLAAGASVSQSFKVTFPSAPTNVAVQ